MLPAFCACSPVVDRFPTLAHPVNLTGRATACAADSHGPDLAAFIRLHERQRLLSGAKTSAGPHLHIGDMGAVDAVASRTAHGIALTGDDPCLNRRGHPRKGGRSRHRGCTAACRQYEKQYSGQMPAATAFECRVQRFEELSACVRQVDECHSHRRRFYRLERAWAGPEQPGEFT